MVETTTNITSSSQVELRPDWHKTDKFTGDEMIDAYFLGRKSGIQAGWDENFKILTTQFGKNIETAVELSEELYKNVLQHNIALKSIHLKAEGISKFTSLFIANPDEYNSDQFLTVHNIAREFRGNKKSDDVYMSFLFMSDSESLSRDCLTAEGYFLQYVKTK